MNITTFLFSNKMPANPDPLWLTGFLLIWGVGLILVGIYGKKFLSKERHKALHKTVKKSSGLLKIFGIVSLVLLWFRLESLRFLSMKVWWFLYDGLFLWFLIVKFQYYRKLQARVQRRERKGK